jgi:uncharacterized protein YyaL (SSP411 family)
MRKIFEILTCWVAAGALALAAMFSPENGAAQTPRPAPPPERYTLLAGATTGDQAQLQQLAGVVAATFDRERGGWVTKGGRPYETAVSFAFAMARDGDTTLWQGRALTTVDWTWVLNDSVGGGFFDRLANTRHDDPSFDKPTYGTAARLENLIEAWKASGDPLYRSHAAKIVDYMDRVLLDGRGGFIDGQVGSRDLMPRSNGLAIHSWLMWAAATGDTRPRDFAERSLDRSWEVCWVDEVGMLRKDNFGAIQKAPQLPDQVEMARAYLLSSHIAGRPVDLERAKTIAELLEKNFADPKGGGWRTQAVALKGGKIRSAASVSDECARAALFLAELGAETGEERWKAAARRAIAGFAHGFEKAGFEAADWGLAQHALLVASLPPKPEWQAGEPTHQKQSKSYGRTRR